VRYVIIILTSLLLWSCDNYRSSVPLAPVNFTLNITSEYPHFTKDNGFQTMIITRDDSRFKYDAVGYAGLLVWVGMDQNYHAADLCCPNCLKEKQPVEIQDFYAICPTCDEHFDLSYGYAFPTKGHTREPLRSYRVSLTYGATGDVLRILNY
jgi:hypothetical protein